MLQSTANVPPEPFLSRVHQESIAAFDQVTEHVDRMAIEGGSLEQQLAKIHAGALKVIVNNSALRHRASVRNQRMGVTPEAFADDLELTALDAASQDAMLGVTERLAAMITGRYVALDPYSIEVARGFEYGYEVIAERVQRNVGSLILATTELQEPYVEFGEKDSIWRQARNVYASTHSQTPPDTISDKERAALRKLQVRVEGQSEAQDEGNGHEVWKPSSSRLMHMVRLLRPGLRVFRKSRGVSEIERLQIVRASVDVAPPMELNDEEMNNSLRTIQKIGRFMEGAGQLDEAIAADSRTRYFGYMLDRLKVTNIKQERAVYDSKVHKFAKHQAAHLALKKG